MNGSTMAIAARDRTAARSSEGITNAEDSNATNDTGSDNKRRKEKSIKFQSRNHDCRGQNIRRERKGRSKKDSKSRRYYSGDDDGSDRESADYRRRQRKRKRRKEKKEKRRSKRKDHDQRKRRKRKRSYSSSSSSSSSDEESISSSSTSSSALDKKMKKKRRRNQSKAQYDDEKRNANNESKTLVNVNNRTKPAATTSASSIGDAAKAADTASPGNQSKRRAMMPMSKEEYDKEQSKIREVYDPLSGRVRLVRGSGEIIERIVSSAAHRQINSLATSGDGYAFSKGIYDKLNR